MYTLREAIKEDIELLEDYSIKIILAQDKDNDPTLEELNNIKEYVHNEVTDNLANYKIIKVNNEIAGAFLITNYEEGIMLNDIYVEDKFRNKHIASSIIESLKTEYKSVYLWVYKGNINAINLYKKLGFYIEKEADTRLFMKCIIKEI